MLTIKQQLLSLFMLDIRYFGIDEHGHYLPQTILSNEIKDLFREYPIGGVILFKENMENEEQVKSLTQELQNIYPIPNQYVAADAQNLPRLIAIDEEGGVVSRIGLETIGNMALGAINDTKVTHENAKIIGQKLKDLGINFNFAPVVDINSNSYNPIIGVRSFGDNPEKVTAHAKEFIKGLDDSSIISCAKHFPGHGDTATDTHHGTTILNKPQYDIEQCELYPYKKLIVENSLNAVMTAHIVVPTLDNNILQVGDRAVAIPATLSYEIITNILRKNLGFNGVIVTDALDMHAINQNFDAVTATIQSIKAGCDIILMPVRIWNNDGIIKFKDYFNQIYTICSKDKDLQVRVAESFARINALKHKLKLNNTDSVSSIYAISNSCQQEKSNNSIQLELAKKAITLYKNTDNYIPFKLDNTSKILFVAENNNLLDVAVNIAQNVISKLSYKDARIEKILLDYGRVNINPQALADYSQIIILTYNLQETLNLDKLFIELNTLKTPYVMFSCRNPYDIIYVPHCTTNILVYGATGFDQTNYKISQFTLNLEATLENILTMCIAEKYNKFCPVII